MGNVTMTLDAVPKGIISMRNKRARTGTAQMSTSYATGGDAILAGDQKFGLMQTPESVEFEPDDGYDLIWDAANNKIKAYVSGGTEVAAVVNLSGVVSKFKAYGR